MSKKPKKEKVIALVLTSRESLESTVADTVRLKLDHATRQAAMEKEIADVQKRHQEGILDVASQIEAKEASIFTYCQRHRAELFTDKKSLDMLLAVIGFEDTPPRVEKRNSKDTWGATARRLQALDWGADYIREGDPEVNKQALLAARESLSDDQLKEAGIRFEQDEQFFIRPKSEVAEDTTKAAA